MSKFIITDPFNSKNIAHHEFETKDQAKSHLERLINHAKLIASRNPKANELVEQLEKATIKEIKSDN